MDGISLKLNTALRYRPKARLSAAIAAAILAVSASAVYFTVSAVKNETTYMEPSGRAQSREEITEMYFQAFRDSDAELYVAAMPEGKLNRQRKLFDSDSELYDSYNSQFEDEYDFFSAIYGSDFTISYEVTDSRTADENSIADEEFFNAAELDITAAISGYKLHRECRGTLTVIETENGWYVYDSDFEEAFW